MKLAFLESCDGLGEGSGVYQMPTVKIPEGKKAWSGKRIGVARGAFTPPKIVDRGNPAIAAMFGVAAKPKP